MIRTNLSRLGFHFLALPNHSQLQINPQLKAFSGSVIPLKFSTMSFAFNFLYNLAPIFVAFFSSSSLQSLSDLKDYLTFPDHTMQPPLQTFIMMFPLPDMPLLMIFQSKSYSSYQAHSSHAPYPPELPSELASLPVGAIAICFDLTWTSFIFALYQTLFKSVLIDICPYRWEANERLLNIYCGCHALSQTSSHVSCCCLAVACSHISGVHKCWLCNSTKRSLCLRQGTWKK